MPSIGALFLTFTLMPAFALWTLGEGLSLTGVRELMKEAVALVADDRSRGRASDAVVSQEPITGLPIVRAIATNSLYERAGLRVGDLIVKVNGLPTMNRSLAQIAETLQLFNGEKAVLTIQRIGCTNRDYFIQ
jgi:C-terminal processing protease CtpA/Prc